MTNKRPPVELVETVASTSTPPDRDASPGALDGPRYAERHLLGRGGMGEVHLRRDEWLGRDVAVKTIGPERSSLGVARARFLREARVQGQLEHPAIVPVYDVGVDDRGHEYFTMKRVTGRTLEDALAAGDLTRTRLLGLFRQVCLAVDYAHARGVVHRDLKPANVMIGDFGEVYVLDWGLAKVLGMASGVDERAYGRGETLSGQMLGTPGYMAPEQIDSANDADERADVYALGAMLFEILAGARLHEGKTPGEVLRSTQAGSPASPSARAPDRDVPPELDVVCVRATARDPGARTIGARDIADAVDRFLEGDRDLAARRALAVKHAAAASGAAGEALSGGPNAVEARARALREAGRALTLDPDNVAGASTLIRLISRPPEVLPEEVRAEVERADLSAMRLRNRKGVAMILVFLVVVLWVSTVGVRSWFLMGCIVVPLLGAFAMTVVVFLSRRLTVRSFERRTNAVVGLGLLAVAFCSVIATSNVVVPVLALAFAVGAAGAARPGPRRIYLVMGLCAFLVPFLVEWLHLVPWALPGLRSAPGGVLVPAAATELPELPVHLMLLVATCASILAPALTLFPVLDAAAELRTQSLLHAWHLRHLAPSEPLQGVGGDD